MDPQTCFICGTKVGRGNRSEMATEEKMNKLVSVKNTVEHSSTVIICDILSRILKEHVMNEESVCRICFNLLNDIDYHLKEAQEKTEEVTAKYLDRDKDPLSYKPQPIMTSLGRKSSSPDHRKHRKWGKMFGDRGGVKRELDSEGKNEDGSRKKGKQVVTTSGGRPGKFSPSSRVLDTHPVRPDSLPKSQQQSRYWQPEFEPISPEPIRRTPDPIRRTPDPIRRTPEPTQRTPEPIRRTPEPIRHAPEPIRRTPESIRRTPESIRRIPIPPVRTTPKVTEHRSRSPSHVPVKGGGKGPRFFKHKDPVAISSSSQEAPPVHQTSASPALPSITYSYLNDKKISPKWTPKPKVILGLASESEIGASSAEEMSVNMVNEKKRKLISRVLGPCKKSKRDEEGGREVEEDFEEDRLIVDTGREKEKQESKERRRKDKKKRKKERERKRVEMEKRVLEQHMKGVDMEKVEEGRTKKDVKSDFVLRLSDDESEEESPRKSTDIRTLDLAQLDDIFSVPQGGKSAPPPQVTPPSRTHRDATPNPYAETFKTSPPSSHEKIYAKKSTPRDHNPNNEKRIPDDQQQFKHEVFIIPDATELITNDNLMLTPQRDAQMMTPQRDSQMMTPQRDTSKDVITTYSVPVTNYDNVVTVDFPGSSLMKNKHFVTKREVLFPKKEHNVQSEAKVFSIRENSVVPDSKSSSPTKSPGIATIPCPQCNKMFMRAYNMRVHIDRVHNKVKPFQCEFCDKSFSTTSDLKQHLSAHGMGKIHKCEDCGREFTNRDSAILHRKQHNNERTHFCPNCSKGFFKASCLQRHMRSHTGEKPYSCEFCGRGFTQATTVKNHKRVCKAAERAMEVGPVTLVHYEDTGVTDTKNECHLPL